LTDTDIIFQKDKENANARKPSFHFIAQLETPKEDELTGNPRSRSAKLRCVERTQSPEIDFPLDNNTWMIDWKKYDVWKSS
jgi:hypothetical protein